MDFASIDYREIASRGATYQLRSRETGGLVMGRDGQPVEFDVFGKDSAEYRRAVALVVAEDMRAKRGKAAKGDVSDAQILQALDDKNANTAKIMARAVFGVRGAEWEGKPIKPTYDELLRLFQKHPWVADQINDFVEDDADFLAHAKTN